MELQPPQPTQRRNAFTIVELLVVISIIALLMGILLPAIGKARERARVLISMTNMRQLGTAHATYAAEWSGRQFTLVDDGLSRYGGSAFQAGAQYKASLGVDHPGITLGWATINGQHGLYGYWMSNAGNYGLLQPIDMSDSDPDGFGWFRIPNAKQFNQYVSGRFYDPVFYAPNDTVINTILDECRDAPGEISDCIGTEDVVWSSYCLSPAALLSPNVMGNRGNTSKPEFTNPWQMHAGFRVPAMSQAAYSELKTQMVEHHWLQHRRRSECNPGFAGGTYDGCEPYYFNLAFESIPNALFFDGHVAPLSVREARAADHRQLAAGAGSLWNRFTPYGLDGYFLGVAYDEAAQPPQGVNAPGGTSFHIFTTDGILGRDVLK